MALQWNPKLSIGLPGIDEQHKELFARINGLLDAMSKGKGKEDLEKVIGFLDEYVRIHFGTEEDFMKKAGYPESATHMEQHQAYVTEFNILRGNLVSQGATSTLAIQTQRFLMEWWLNHINKSDMGMGAFLKSNA